MSTHIDALASQPGKVVIQDTQKNVALVGNVTCVEWDSAGFDATGKDDLVVMKDYATIFGVVDYCRLNALAFTKRSTDPICVLDRLTAQVNSSRLLATGRVSKLFVYNDLKEDDKPLSFCVTVRFYKLREI